MFSVFGTEKLVVENVERFEPQFDAKRSLNRIRLMTAVSTFQ